MVSLFRKKMNLVLFESLCERSFPNVPEQVSLIRPGYTDVFSPIRYDEFGLPTSHHTWGASVLFSSVLQEMFEDCSQIKINSYAAGDESTAQSDDVIHLPDLFAKKRKQLGLEHSTRQLPLLYNFLSNY